MDGRFSEALGGAYLSAFMGFGAIVIGLLSFVLILYINSFLMKQRKQEYGLYNVLGMEKRHIVRVLFFESLLTSLLSVALGLVFGALFYKASSLLICKLLHRDIVAGFYYLSARAKNIRSTVKYANHGCTRSAKSPQYLAENMLARNFYAEKPNEKWLTDVTEFKWYCGEEKHKLYLSAILDLCDRRSVAYVIRDRNDNALVFDTFDLAVAANPDAHPIFHSDRGFQYTNNTFHAKLTAAKMIQSMSRVGKCIDNGPMEGFWGILKRECYYGRKFTDRETLIQTIENYIRYYNTGRL